MTRPHAIPALRPRDLVTELFARALDGDPAAEDDLRCLAPADAVADAALEAVVVAEIDARFRADPDGTDVPPTPPELLQRILAVLDTAQAGLAMETAAGDGLHRCGRWSATRQLGDDAGGGEFGAGEGPGAGPVGRPESSSGRCGSSGAAPCRRGDH